ncbi:MAG TPA: phosphate signaling complex protein PhoU [Bacteroidia bacterium]|jgi:phosphate transport system protein|nr:phosphate signaling complex protein PhoU [Bacteroidia bacterium]HRG53035.1 phosphate signaling complex protein PhoU [Bacteroidia bacterium]
MSHLDIELQQLKTESIKMWSLVNLQLRKGKEALLKLDKDLAREVILSERRVNAYELKLDRDCENIFALFNPVAVDLRFVLAVLKINSNLERTGDIVEGIARFVLNVDNTFDKKLLELTRVVEMYTAANSMMESVLEAFEKEDTALARKIFKEDELLDDINIKANAIVAQYVHNQPQNVVEAALYLLSIIRKLERVGDQAKNMAEEIIFYIEAKVLKHRSKVEKSE